VAASSGTAGLNQNLAVVSTKPRLARNASSAVTPAAHSTNHQVDCDFEAIQSQNSKGLLSKDLSNKNRGEPFAHLDREQAMAALPDHILRSIARTTALERKQADVAE
jgi:hypothetical protein